MLFCLSHKTYGKVRSKQSSKICGVLGFFFFFSVCAVFWVLVGFFVCFCFVFAYLGFFLCADEWEFPLFHQSYIKHHWDMFLACVLCHNLSLEVLCLCALFENHGVLHTLTSVVRTLAWEAVFGSHSGFSLSFKDNLLLSSYTVFICILLY